MRLTTLVATLGVAAVAAAPAVAKPKEPFQPGADCHGQTVAFLAQVAGGFSKAAATSPKALHDQIKADCALLNANPSP